MKNSLLTLSKTFYVLAFISLFLPTFIPSCSSTSESASCYDTATTVVDTSVVAIDTLTATQLPAMREQEEVSSEGKSIWQPDGENYSFWGYLLISFTEGMAWIYVLSLLWGGFLKFVNRHYKTSAILSVLGFICLTVIDKDKVVWEFWIIYGISFLLTIINVLHYYQERKKLLLNKG